RDVDDEGRLRVQREHQPRVRTSDPIAGIVVAPDERVVVVGQVEDVRVAVGNGAAPREDDECLEPAAAALGSGVAQAVFVLGARERELTHPRPRPRCRRPLNTYAVTSYVSHTAR